MNTNKLIAAVTEAVLKQWQDQQQMHSPALAVTPVCTEKRIPVGVSNRHVHLSQADLAILFGPEFQLSRYKELSQPGQFACEQKVTLVGAKGIIQNVRILGPVRSKTQVEISAGDGVTLGVKAPLRDSGDLQGSAGIALLGPAGVVMLQEGVIVAARHIHMHSSDAVRWGVQDGDRVSVRVTGPRGIIFNEVLIRSSDQYKLEMHIDLDEANAAFLKNAEYVEIIGGN